MANKPSPAQSAESSAPQMDYAEHDRTYRGFLFATKWGTIVTAIVVVILYFVIQP